MTQISNGDSVRVVLSPPSLRLSTMAGLLSCVFAIVAVFVFPIVFVPVALACALAGGIASLRRGNSGGLAASGLGVLIAIGAAIKSPAIWIAIAVGLFATHQATKPHSATSQPVSGAASTTRPSVDDGHVAVRNALSAARDFNGNAPALTMGLQRYAAGFQHASTRLGEFSERMDSASPAEREQIVAAVVVAQQQLDNGHGAYLKLRDDVNRRLPAFETALGAGVDACERRADLRASTDCQALMAEVPGLRENARALKVSSVALQQNYQAERSRAEEIARKMAGSGR
jgi:hypothetical protein